MSRFSDKILSGIDDWFRLRPERCHHDSYYRSRWADKIGLDFEEEALAHWLSEHRPPRVGDRTLSVVEIGCGYAQMSAYLDHLGYSVDAIEGAENRIDGAEHLCQYLDSGFRVIRGFYPAVIASRRERYDLGVVTNIANSWWSNQPGTEEDKWGSFIRPVRELVFNARVWFRDRNDREQDELIERLRSWGYAPALAVSTFWLVPSPETSTR